MLRLRLSTYLLFWLYELQTRVRWVYNNPDMPGKEHFSFRNDFQLGSPADFQVRQTGDRILREHHLDLTVTDLDVMLSLTSLPRNNRTFEHIRDDCITLNPPSARPNAQLTRHPEYTDYANRALALTLKRMERQDRIRRRATNSHDGELYDITSRGREQLRKAKRVFSALPAPESKRYGDTGSITGIMQIFPDSIISFIKSLKRHKRKFSRRLSQR
ncbi:hypothetical protein M1271_00975 [Patescibacteria group bacterium]|nr:hypothetical protein [Patescibacteria group bacterium]MCL5798439.1 hypothetical protein [Patescibacteria group bacterium]